MPKRRAKVVRERDVQEGWLTLNQKYWQKGEKIFDEVTEIVQTAAPQLEAIAGAAQAFTVDFIEKVNLAHTSNTGRLSCHNQWVDFIQNIFDELHFDCHLEIDDDHPTAVSVVTGLSRASILSNLPPAPQLDIGAECLAVLNQDGDWHHATIVDGVSSSGTDEYYNVRFTKWGHTQRTSASQVLSLSQVADDDIDMRESSGCCELCERYILLTFHHLIPRDTHARYLGKCLPQGVLGEPTKLFLHSYGAWLCRPCHNFIHSFASNVTLAEEYNSIERLLEQPQVLKWKEFASTCRVGLNEQAR